MSAGCEKVHEGKAVIFFSFWFQEGLPAEERKEQAALGDLHVVAADEDSRSEHSSVEEGKEDSRLLLKRLKALGSLEIW